MSWERPDPPRDEDRYYEDEAMVPPVLLSTEETAAERDARMRRFYREEGHKLHPRPLPPPTSKGITR